MRPTWPGLLTVKGVHGADDPKYAYGGRNEGTTGDVTANTVTIDMANVADLVEEVYGGMASAEDNTGAVDHNTANMKNGTTHLLYGGYTFGKSAVTNNKVQFDGGTSTGYVAGGYLDNTDSTVEVSDASGIMKTVHLIIDEAHNILSSQSTREEESWKDYRLEVFEEIIKEGRKFGFYITLASQRPYDISPTIVSQLHNYFIHRLVNEQDLKMIANTVNTLDTISRNQIPTLAPGQCIITGTSFEMPLLIQVEKLSKEKSPTSESADLVKLWT